MSCRFDNIEYYCACAPYRDLYLIFHVTDNDINNLLVPEVPGYVVHLAHTFLASGLETDVAVSPKQVLI